MKSHKSVIALLCTILILTTAAGRGDDSNKLLEWMDETGMHRIEAAFETIEGDFLILRSALNKRIAVKIHRLHRDSLLQLVRCIASSTANVSPEKVSQAAGAPANMAKSSLNSEGDLDTALKSNGLKKVDLDDVIHEFSKFTFSGTELQREVQYRQLKTHMEEYSKGKLLFYKFRVRDVTRRGYAQGVQAIGEAVFNRPERCHTAFQLEVLLKNAELINENDLIHVEGPLKIKFEANSLPRYWVAQIRVNERNNVIIYIDNPRQSLERP